MRADFQARAKNLSDGLVPVAIRPRYDDAYLEFLEELNRSYLNNALNKVTREQDAGIAEAFKLVAQAVESSGNAEVAENFNAFTEELPKPEPNKSLLKLFGMDLLQLCQRS